MAKSKCKAENQVQRRAESPSLDVDKSLTSLPRVESDAVQRDSILADRANAGVAKKQSKPKSKSRAQRLRQQKGFDRAEIVIDQLEKKVAGSVKRGKSVQARRADWDDLNRNNTSTFAVLQAQSADDAPDDGDNAMADNPSTPAPKDPVSKPAQTFQPVQEPQNHAVGEDTGADEDDEIT